jgi:hypothetical protein
MDSVVQQSRTGVVAELDRLAVEERELSDRRNELHRRIDAIYLAAPLTAEDVSLLDELEGLEHNLSSERARLHLRIDDLRAEIGLPPWRQSLEDADETQAAAEIL